MFPVARAVLLSMRERDDFGCGWKLSAAEQVKRDCCHTPAVVCTLLTPLPVSCPLTTLHHYNFGAARAGSAKQRPILTMNAADNPGQPPAPPTLHSLRPHKLRRFSGDEGDAAEDFVREAKLFLELGPMADPAAAAWLREGSGQAGSAVHGGRRSQHPWQNLRHPGAALGRTSRLLHPCWGVLQAPAGAHRVGGGVRLQLSSPLGENQCCPGGHPLPYHAAGHLCGWASSRVSEERHKALHSRECRRNIRRCQQRGPPLDEGRQLPWHHRWAAASSPQPRQSPPAGNANRRALNGDRQPESSSSNTRATTEPHPARATRLVHHLTEGLWPVAYAPLNVGGANDVATLKLDARPGGSTSSDGVASAKNSYRETSNPRCFHQAGNGG